MPDAEVKVRSTKRQALAVQKFLGEAVIPVEDQQYRDDLAKFLHAVDEALEVRKTNKR